MKRHFYIRGLRRIVLHMMRNSRLSILGFAKKSVPGNDIRSSSHDLSFYINFHYYDFVNPASYIRHFYFCNHTLNIISHEYFYKLIVYIITKYLHNYETSVMKYPLLRHDRNDHNFL